MRIEDWKENRETIAAVGISMMHQDELAFMLDLVGG